MPRIANMPATPPRPSTTSSVRSGRRPQKLRDDLGPLLCFFDFPAEHWLHLKTSKPIESTFSTVRLRTKVTKGPGSRAAGLAMALSSSRPRRGRPLALCQRCLR